MATLDNILSDYLEGGLEYLFHKLGQNEIKYNEYIDNLVINPHRLACSSYNIKHYIKIGSECPICYEEIFTNKTAFINKCGHYFHTKCIVECINRHYDNYQGECPCPMCRTDIDTDELFLYERYRIDYKKKNYLDILENFYDDKSFKINKHYCKICKIFYIGKECYNYHYRIDISNTSISNTDSSDLFSSDTDSSDLFSSDTDSSDLFSSDTY
jgi:hypothetical protein